MGQSTNGRNPKSKPAARVSSIADRLAERRAGRGKGADTADWVSVDANIIQRAIGSVSAAGGAIQFGYTRDGGAYSVNVYIGGELLKDYIRPSEDVERYLEELSEDIGSIASDHRQPGDGSK